MSSKHSPCQHEGESHQADLWPALTRAGPEQPWQPSGDVAGRGGSDAEDGVFRGDIGETPGSVPEAGASGRRAGRTVPGTMTLQALEASERDARCRK